MTFLLAGLERPVLLWLAARVPRGIRSNHLTALGTIGATAAGVAYALTRYDARWLWVASAMLVVNWLGDSLDGTLARVRNTQRPKYGYYLDHVMDLANTVVLFAGLAVSGIASPFVAAGLLVCYLLLAAESFLATHAIGVFRISFGAFGP